MPGERGDGKEEKGNTDEQRKVRQLSGRAGVGQSTLKQRHASLCMNLQTIVPETTIGDCMPLNRLGQPKDSYRNRYGQQHMEGCSLKASDPSMGSRVAHSLT